jgi:SRSO17 transposase
LGGEVGTGLNIDESAFTKKGKKSVGVARQWNGRLGKTDNCQVAVYGALGKDRHVSLIDARLYLPKEWLGDPRRCVEAEIPRAKQVHKTKHDLALEIVAQARQRSVRFEWIGMDAFCGMSLSLLQAQRYWIERAFQDAKSHIGMGQYQARKWASWHRHMALVMMAHQFMLQERMQNTAAYPLLSCYDIQILLAKTLPARQKNELEVLELMEERHRKRQAAIDSARERQRRTSRDN